MKTYIITCLDKKNSLKKRLRSHAPLAYSVSGGIDSSILYCLSEKINQSTLKYPIGIFSYFNQQKNNDFFYIQQINKNKKGRLRIELLCLVRLALIDILIRNVRQETVLKKY